jgi:hypothetical protein
MINRRRALIALTSLSLLIPICLAPMETQAIEATGFKGTVTRLPKASLARKALRVLAINANRSTVVDVATLNKDHQYRMPLAPGLYMVGAKGLRTTGDGFTHAIRLQKGQMRRVDLPPGSVSRTTLSSFLTSINPAAAGTAPVVTVGPITVHGMSEFREGADLWMVVDMELEQGSRPRCKVTYTSNQARDLAQKEVDFQQTHNVDPSTEITPNFVTPTSRVSGTITQTGGTVTVSLTEKDLATGDVKQSKTVSGPKASFFDLLDTIGRRVGRNLCRFGRIAGSITYNETTSTSATPCCSDEESLDATIDVAMKGYGGSFPGFEDDGSTYDIQYSLTSSGQQSDCNYQGVWSGSGGGPLRVDAGKLIEPGETSPLTGEPAETYELVVGVETGLDYTYSGSETYSGCANTNNNGTIPHGNASTYLEHVYKPCDGVTNLLEFKGPDETSLTLNCSLTEDDTTYTLDGTLTVEY